MIRAISLLLPVLIPSWRFFAMVAPSPRIEFSVLDTPEATATDWREFRPRPKSVSWFEIVERLFANAYWNDSLFLTSCAERYLQDGSQVHYEFIVSRLREELNKSDVGLSGGTCFQLRLMLAHRSDDKILRDEVHRSPVLSLLCEQSAP